MSDRHLDNLRNAILKLDPTGQDGFEGLMASVLAEVTGQPFRLASSGTQRGRDGDSAFDQGATYFEAKRYDGKIPKERIAVKLMEILADEQGQVDTFIVGATSPIPAQDAREFNRMAESSGLGIVLLDWISNTPLPPLATVLTMGGSATKAFLCAQLNGPDDADLLSKALTAIDQLAMLPEFNAHSERLRAEVSNPSVGLGLAKRANREWFSQLFSCQKLARQQLGQPLAPCDRSMDYLQIRTHLYQDLQGAFRGQSPEKVFVVMGLEGTGKSWLLANTWMQSDPASILAIAPAGELQEPEDITNFESFLIEKLIGQTEGEHSDSNRKRWRRRFAAWRANPEPPNVRLTVCIDGLNQNPRFPWPRLIDGATLFLGQIGGQLVVTTRTNHFQSIRQAITTDVARVLVPEWSEIELEGILRSRSIDPDVVDAGVFETLRNPRILDIAVNLLNTRDIENIDQLSVERLLFEHLRTSGLTGSSDLSGPEFAMTLTELAKEYVSRLEAGREDDLTLFDTRDHSRLDEVSSGRFFKPVDDDPDQYQIVDEGLRLGLGLWLVDALRKEYRNRRDPFERIETVMEPVAGLDMTSEIVCTATEVACLSDTCRMKVKTASIRYYVSLQNLPEHKRESFGALVKHSPEAFLEAAKEVALFDEGVPTSDWLNVAIMEARNDARVVSAIEQRIPVWLSYYCLAPEQMMHVSASSSPEEIEAERVRVTSELEKRLEELTDVEKRYMEANLIELQGGNIDRLQRLAMYFLAGQPLKKLVGPLVSSAFCGSLAPAIDVPRRELAHLVRFNFVDWAATREAMLGCIECFGEERSSIGNWTIAKVLSSTGDLSDAMEAQRVAEVLTASFERIASWRLIETYCATDPCDPKSSRPENISNTAENYQSIVVDQVCATMGNGSETHFFREAMPGIARFEPKAGAYAIRELSKHALTRQGVAWRLATMTLLPHSVLLNRPEVDAFVRKAQSTSGGLPSHSDVPDEWLSAQHSLFIALPHLSGNEQFRALDGMCTDSYMLRLLDTIQPAESDVVESLLKAAFAATDTHRLVRLLAAVHSSNAPLTAEAAEIIADLLKSPESMVRAEALAIASTSKNRLLLERLVDSDWCASKLTSTDNHFELWYGSAALVEAVGIGVSSFDLVLDRLALGHYGIAATRLGTSAARQVADRVEVALEKALDLGEFTDLPEMEQELLSGNSTMPMISLREKSPDTDPQSALRRFAETDEQFQQRRKMLHRAFTRFNKELTDSDAHLVLSDLTSSGMAAIISAKPEIIGKWHTLLLEASDVQKRSVQCFAVRFAGELAEKHTELALSLFRAYSAVRPLMRCVVGLAKIPIEADVLWSHASVSEISKLCLERLENCANDQEIAVEVLAALSHNQEVVLASYVETLLAAGEPVHIARALAIAGFADESDFADDAISRFDEAKGFVGEAHSAARDAYDRNRWSRHWFDCMQTATSQLDFWRYSVLLSRIVDGRITLWGRFPLTEETFRAFIPTIQNVIGQRINKWETKRKKTLFGGKVPHVVFLVRDYTT